METVRIDGPAVRTLAERVLDGADRLDEIRWGTMPSDALIGSAVGPAVAEPVFEQRLAECVAHLRTWATAAQAAATAMERAELRHADRLGEPR
jgi:hypothetical protein